MRAAVPHYMKDMNQASPGHRFSLYFKGWTERWTLADTEKQRVLNDVVKLNHEDRLLLSALIGRQQAQAKTLGETVFATVACSTAPFVTGMGYEHPLENGFAFLSPYGLPYLPGSSVKGVLRRSAEELVLSGQADGFDMLDVWLLFGFDGNAGFLSDRASIAKAFSAPERLADWLKQVLPDDFKKRGLDDPYAFLEALPGDQTLRRSLFNMGALSFWDAFPSGNLTVEIMTPHHSNYLQGKDTPHDSEKPNPIPFLAIAPGAKFHFFVQQIGDAGGCDWRAVLAQCFMHAFEWLGFGAKTAVGYGAMVEDPVIVERRKREKEARRKAEEEQRRREEEARRRQEEERRAKEEEKRRRAELGAMPEHQRALVEAEGKLQALRKRMTKLDLSGYGDLRHLIKDLLNKAEQWDEIARAKVADWIENTLDGLEDGWRHPDMKSKKRKEWERKTRAALDKLRKKT